MELLGAGGEARIEEKKRWILVLWLGELGTAGIGLDAGPAITGAAISGVTRTNCA